MAAAAQAGHRGGRTTSSCSSSARPAPPFLRLAACQQGKEHLGGFTVIMAPDLDAALAWGGKLARATTLPVEVRPFYGEDSRDG